jgi:hypothetical protein
VIAVNKRVGKQTINATSKPRIISTASIVGPKEGEGPLKDYFDIILEDDSNGKDTYEKAESSMIRRPIYIICCSNSPTHTYCRDHTECQSHGCCS